MTCNPCALWTGYWVPTTTDGRPRNVHLQMWWSGMIKSSITGDNNVPPHIQSGIDTSTKSLGLTTTKFVPLQISCWSKQQYQISRSSTRNHTNYSLKVLVPEHLWTDSEWGTFRRASFFRVNSKGNSCLISISHGPCWRCPLPSSSTGPPE